MSTDLLTRNQCIANHITVADILLRGTHCADKLTVTLPNDFKVLITRGNCTEAAKDIYIVPKLVSKLNNMIELHANSST